MNNRYSSTSILKRSELMTKVEDLIVDIANMKRDLKLELVKELSAMGVLKQKFLLVLSRNIDTSEEYVVSELILNSRALVFINRLMNADYFLLNKLSRCLNATQSEYINFDIEMSLTLFDIRQDIIYNKEWVIDHVLDMVYTTNNIIIEK